MTELTLVRVTSNGASLVLTDENMNEYSLAINEELIRAVTPKPARPTMQMRLPVDGPVTPKHVQYRIRHGASIDEVATEAGMPREKVESFAVPVMQERMFICQRAQACKVPTGGSLNEVVQERLLSRGILLEPEWDAWRRPDGNWTVMVRFGGDQASVSTSDESGTFVYSTASKSVEPDDEIARWLINAPEPVVVETVPLDEAVPAEPEPEPEWDTLHPATRAAVTRAAAAARPVVVDEDVTTLARTTPGAAVTPAGPGGKPLSRRAARRRASKRNSAASEPTWDEILFGSPNDKK